MTLAQANTLREIAQEKAEEVLLEAAALKVFCDRREAERQVDLDRTEAFRKHMSGPDFRKPFVYDPTHHKTQQPVVTKPTIVPIHQKLTNPLMEICGSR